MNMSGNLFSLIALLSPLFFVLTAIVSWFQPGFKPQLVKKVSTIATFISISTAVLCGIIVLQYGLFESEQLAIANLGFSIRLDSLSFIMLIMIALLGFIIIKFSGNYLDGDQRQGAFIGRLAATIASVQLMVLSGNLGILMISWVLTSISLHRLLVFYRDRPGAQIAARKKFILARMSDLSLLTAIIMIYNYFGTGNFEAIFNAIKETSIQNLPFSAIEGPAIFLALAALLKSAQFPTHGWLIEVMETPTPVSALLHAGLLNAGPFLIIRMAFIMDASTIAPIILIIIGGITALFGSVVYLTQTSVKTALGYSSIAHMGFSLMTSGLGVYSAALLHLVAHSFYKAHAFLSSGSVIDVIRGSKVAKPSQSTSPMKIALGMTLSLLLYTGFAILWGINPVKQLPLLVIGVVIMLGLARIFTSAINLNGGANIIIQGSLMALMVTVAFFSLESALHYILSSQLPGTTIMSTGKQISAILVLITFCLAIFAQIIGPSLSQTPFYRTLAIHIRNGLYINTIFDRLIGALRIHSAESKKVIKAGLLEEKYSKSTEQNELEKQLV